MIPTNPQYQFSNMNENLYGLRLRRSLLLISSLLNAFAIFWLFCLAEIYLVDSVIHRLNKRGQEFAVYDSCIRVKE